eukprot:TRINITY_DN120797_c0_g1_i1.p1 TRINITY_DN120797_c0_g1~~TRINITY_DN120797_c0_g1_i1.p1  ORF type:complete len:865 (-),score=247.44 TRINITY_DN120797_c0_g1_i1:108-2702(-)
MGVVEMPMDGQRQLERATRLLDAPPQGKRTPVRKSLEQLFGESRVRGQPAGSVGLLGGGASAAPLGGASAFFGVGALGGAGALGNARLLQSPQAQKLEREVADFTLGPGVASASSTATAAPSGGGLSGAAAEDQPGLGLREFFGLRHERVLLCAIEEAQRDCMASMERHSFNRIQADWEDAKSHILRALGSQSGASGAGAVGAALRSGADASTATTSTLPCPAQDVAIIDALLREPLNPALLQRIARLSCEGCSTYRNELEECWSIVSNQLQPTPRAVVSGGVKYLQDSFAAAVKKVVYSNADARLGGKPDAWSLVKAFGRMKFGVANFPSNSMQVWYAAYVAARCGYVDLLMDLQQRAAPASERCPMLKTVCSLLARRLEAAAGGARAASAGGGLAGNSADAADLLRAELSEEGNEFHNVLVALLLGKSFSFNRLPEGTIEDWIWFRLHALLAAAGGQSDQGPEFVQQLQALRQHASAVPSSHYDPAAGAAGAAAAGGGPSGAYGDLGGFRGSADAGLSGGGVVQTLNFVKALLLTAQFTRALQQLQNQDRCLQGPALHLALVLHRAGTLDALSAPEPPQGIANLVCDYASGFRVGDQLQYFRMLDLHDRVKALQRLVLKGGVGTNDELLGHIDANGRHRPGLLERTLHEDGAGDGAEFADLCARAGRAAAEHGQYREAIRLLHLGKCYTEVLTVLCRCLRLPIWREALSQTEDAKALGQDVQRFFAIYENNLDRYALSSQAWAVARKLFAARTFHALVDQGCPEAALDVFDREQLLPLSLEQQELQMGSDGCSEAVDAVLAEQPKIVADYVRILRAAAASGVVVLSALRARVRQLQAFLGAQSHNFALDQETVAVLASLALC